MGRTVVHDRVHGVEAEPVEIVLLEPVERVLDREVAHRAAVLAVVVDAGAPRRLVAVGEEGRRVDGQVIAVGSEMIIDAVEDHHHVASVRGFDEVLEVVRPAVGGVGRVEEHPVVAPVPSPREVGDRHYLDRRDAERREMVEPPDRRRERSLGRKGANVQLVDDGLGPGAAGEPVAPVERRRVDHLARPVHVVGLEAARRIGDQHPVRQSEPITRAGPGRLGDQLVPALAGRRHRHRLGVVHRDRDRGGARCPKAEPHATVGRDLGTVRHGMASRHGSAQGARSCCERPIGARPARSTIRCRGRFLPSRPRA